MGIGQGLREFILDDLILNPLTCLSQDRLVLHQCCASITQLWQHSHYPGHAVFRYFAYISRPGGSFEHR
jgi:hypothetical protein